MTKKQKLEILNKKMASCKKCSLRDGCEQVVPGAGSVTAEIMFIGEAPGANEDREGIPFIGISGRFLDKMLESINLSREDIYIANTVNCRPPANRDPSRKEKEICWEWLEKQIEITRPKLIITLGRHSMERFFPKKKISEAHGELLQEEINLRQGRDKLVIKQSFYILYHPAAALCNNRWKKALVEDFAKIPGILKKISK